MRAAGGDALVEEIPPTATDVAASVNPKSGFNRAQAFRSVVGSIVVNAVCPYIIYRYLEPKFSSGSLAPLGVSVARTDVGNSAQAKCRLRRRHLACRDLHRHGCHTRRGKRQAGAGGARASGGVDGAVLPRDGPDWSPDHLPHGAPVCCLRCTRNRVWFREGASARSWAHLPAINRGMGNRHDPHQLRQCRIRHYGRARHLSFRGAGRWDRFERRVDRLDNAVLIKTVHAISFGMTASRSLLPIREQSALNPDDRFVFIPRRDRPEMASGRVPKLAGPGLDRDGLAVTPEPAKRAAERLGTPPA
jgi:hypothetical protein